MQLGTITLTTEIGTTTIELKHVRRITLQKDPEAQATDTVQLADKSIVRGRVTEKQFVVDRDGGGEVTWKRSEVREIQVVTDVPVSLMAVLLGLLTLTAMEIILGVDNIVFSEALSAEGALVFAKACEMGLEGIVSKRAGSRYSSGNSQQWRKSKNPAFVRG